jgi:sarcosine oxidase/L-pipecolate oxidase
VWTNRCPQLDCAHTPESIKALQQTYQALLSANLGSTHEWLSTSSEILEKAPVLDARKITDWKAIFSHDGGWLAASKAINAIGSYLRSQGVNFHSGDAGSFSAPLLTNEGVCIGVETADGSKYYADKVVLAAGAWSPVLVDLEEQCCSKVCQSSYATLAESNLFVQAWVYAHLYLTPSEASEYKSTPVVYNPSIGFFFEPTESGIIKVCDEFPGFTRFKLHQPFGADAPKQISVPRSHAKHPTDTYPDASELTIRKAIATFLPKLEEKELFNRQLCWCTDTADAALLVCEHPRWKNFVVATGDSGYVAYLPCLMMCC